MEGSGTVINSPQRNDLKKRLLTIHTHPSSFPLSIPNFNANFENEYNLGMVICHGGKVFLYAAEDKINEDCYNLLVAKKLNQGYNEYETMITILQEIQEILK